MDTSPTTRLPAFYSCVNATIEDAFDASSDAEPIEADESQTGSRYNTNDDGADLLSNATVTSRRSSATNAGSAAFLPNDPGTFLEESQLSASLNLNLAERVLQGNQPQDATSSAWNIPPTASSSSPHRLSTSHASFSDEPSRMSASIINNDDGSSSESDLSAFTQDDLSSDVAANSDANWQRFRPDSASSAQHHLETKSQAGFDSENLAGTHVRSSGGFRPPASTSSAGAHLATSLFLADDKVMEIVEEHLENDDDDDEDNMEEMPGPTAAAAAGDSSAFTFDEAESSVGSSEEGEEEEDEVEEITDDDDADGMGDAEAQLLSSVGGTVPDSLQDSSLAPLARSGDSCEPPCTSTGIVRDDGTCLDTKITGLEDHDPGEGPTEMQPVEPNAADKEVTKVKKKRKKKMKDSAADGGDAAGGGAGDGVKPPKKKKRKRTKEEREKRERERSEALTKKTLFERRNIRKILESDNLDEETKAAQKEEMERRKRLQEIQEKLRVQALELRAQREQEMMSTLEQLKNSALKSLLEDKSMSPPESPLPLPIKPTKPPADVVEISSSDEDEDSDLIMMPSDQSEEEDSEEGGEEDLQNSGSHTNDAMNQRDAMGGVLVNVGHPPSEPGIYLAPQLAAAVKPHQIGGIRFLYDNLIESIEHFKTSNGLGCILAHSMGLGKTLQIISFVDIFLRHTGAKSVLIIVPVNTLQNWITEFNMWLPVAAAPTAPSDTAAPPAATTASSNDTAAPMAADSNVEAVPLVNAVPVPENGNMAADAENGDIAGDTSIPAEAVKEEKLVIPEIDRELFWPREFKVFVVNDNMKTNVARAKVVADWHKTGGVLLLGYEMYRLLTTKRVLTKPRRAAKKNAAATTDAVIDLEEEDTNKELLKGLHEALMRPGPDLVICDEGHRIKNSHASISQALKNIRTKRRVVLTGYPLQNNLLEYWCMVDFVRPNYLGTRTEFCNMFERPIMNGQCKDSTPEDIKLMRFRSHVLHSLLEGFVQRRGHAVLRAALPHKEEYVLLVRMSLIQRQLYNAFMKVIQEGGLASWANGNNPIKAFSVFCKIWNHPDILHQVLEQRKDDNDLDIEDTKAADLTATGPVAAASGPGGHTAHAPRRSRAKINKAASSASLAHSASSTMLPHAASLATLPQSASMATLQNSASMADLQKSIAMSLSSLTPSASSTSLSEFSKPVCSSISNSPITFPGGISFPGISGGLATPTGSLMSSPAVQEIAVKGNMSGGTVLSGGTISGASIPSLGGLSLGSDMTGGGVVKMEVEAGGNSAGDGSTAATATSGSSDTTAVSTPVSTTAAAAPDFKKESQVISYDWANDVMKDYVAGVIEHSGKMVILMEIIDECIKLGEKILIFSQSLLTLGLIEEYLSKQTVPGFTDEYWAKNKNYFRLDGSTSGLERERLINMFNSEDNYQIRIFLLSTRAGCLGINLIGASRVVVFDASWNPCHDCQAVCRVYRYGQARCCFVYRFVTDNTMEKNIYDRQINKQGISDRIVDELNPQNLLERKQVDMLLRYEDKEMPTISPEGCEERCSDPILINVVKKYHDWITKEPFNHESLLLDAQEKRLTKREKRLAQQSYENDKKMSLRPSYYPRPFTGIGGDMSRMPINIRYTQSVGGRPVASVRPMMSTPLGIRSQSTAAGHTRLLIPAGRNSGTGGGLKPGVSLQQIQTTTDILIPGTNTSSDSGPSKIPAGEKVLVIKTPKGVYIRTNQGKIFAVRTAPKGTGATSTSATTTSGPSAAKTSSTTTVSTTSVLAGGITSTGTAKGGDTVVRKSGSGPPLIIRQGSSSRLPIVRPMLNAAGSRPRVTPSIIRTTIGRSSILSVNGPRAVRQVVPSSVGKSASDETATTTSTTTTATSGEGTTATSGEGTTATTPTTTTTSVSWSSATNMNPSRFISSTSRQSRTTTVTRVQGSRSNMSGRAPVTVVQINKSASLSATSSAVACQTTAGATVSTTASIATATTSLLTSTTVVTAAAVVANPRQKEVTMSSAKPLVESGNGMWGNSSVGVGGVAPSQSNSRMSDFDGLLTGALDDLDDIGHSGFDDFCRTISTGGSGGHVSSGHGGGGHGGGGSAASSRGLAAPTPIEPTPQLSNMNIPSAAAVSSFGYAGGDTMRTQSHHPFTPAPQHPMPMPTPQYLPSPYAMPPAYPWMPPAMNPMWMPQPMGVHSVGHSGSGMGLHPHTGGSGNQDMFGGIGGGMGGASFGGTSFGGGTGLGGSVLGGSGLGGSGLGGSGDFDFGDGASFEPLGSDANRSLTSLLAESEPPGFDSGFFGSFNRRNIGRTAGMMGPGSAGGGYMSSGMQSYPGASMMGGYPYHPYPPMYNSMPAQQSHYYPPPPGPSPSSFGNTGHSGLGPSSGYFPMHYPPTMHGTSPASMYPGISGSGSGYMQPGAMMPPPYGMMGPGVNESMSDFLMKNE